MSSAAALTPRTTSSRPRAGARPLVVVGATLVALAVWAVAVPILGADLLVDTGSGTRPVGPAAVAATSAGAGLAGWGLLALLERLTGRGRTIWTVTAVVVLLVSFLGPLTGGTTAIAQTVLSLLHLAVAAVLIGGLPNTSRPRRLRTRTSGGGLEENGGG